MHACIIFCSHNWLDLLCCNYVSMATPKSMGDREGGKIKLVFIYLFFFVSFGKFCVFVYLVTMATFSFFVCLSTFECRLTSIDTLTRQVAHAGTCDFYSMLFLTRMISYYLQPSSFFASDIHCLFIHTSKTPFTYITAKRAKPRFTDFVFTLNLESFYLFWWNTSHVQMLTKSHDVRARRFYLLLWRVLHWTI